MRGLPRWVLAPAVLGALFVVVPLAALVLRVDVAPGPDGSGGFWALVTSDEALDALGLSLRTSLTATVCCIILGAPMALVLARTTFPGQRVARSLVLLPLVLPPVVGGIALLYTFGRRGLIGEHLQVLGISVAFSTTAVVMAQTFVALPFLVLSLEGALRTQDTRFEDVAATLGARPTTVLRRVTLPRVLPALASGSVLAFARALGEFGATITFAGALQGVTQTLPLEIYLQRSADPDAAVALSLVLVVVAVVITAAVHGPGVLGGPTPARTARRRPAAGVGPGEREERPSPVVAGALVAGPVVAVAATTPEAQSPTPPPPAALQVRAVVPERGVDVALDIAPGEVVAVLGDNGAGKSTLVQVVAGLLDARASRGSSVVLDGDDVSRTPARDRHVAWVSQRPLLFAHLSVAANAAFGPRARGASRAVAKAEATGALRRVGAVGLADRPATDLSGGQAQRVSIARALATDPRVLLLDEPLASLDVAVAQHVRTALHDAQRARPRTTLLVTHDLLDVLVLADRVVVLEDGKLVEDGPAAEVLTRPRSRFAARLAGVNLLVGTVSAVTDAVVTLAADSGAHAVGTADEPVAVGDPVVAVFEPRAVGVHRAAPEGSPRNAFPVVVTGVEPQGALLRVWARVSLPDDVPPASTPAGDAPHLAADLTPRAATELHLVSGERVWFVVKAAEVGVHPR